jgi:hypothetical protein
MVLNLDCTAPWGALRSKVTAGGRWRLFTIEATLDETFGNWYHFIKPTHRIRNLLTVKQLLNAVSYYLPQWTVQTAVLKNALYRVEQGALEMSLWNQVGGGPEKFGNHWFRVFF